jgi:hypothetical protein
MKLNKETIKALCARIPDGDYSIQKTTKGYLCAFYTRGAVDTYRQYVEPALKQFPSTETKYAAAVTLLVEFVDKKTTVRINRENAAPIDREFDCMQDAIEYQENLVFNKGLDAEILE